MKHIVFVIGISVLLCSAALAQEKELNKIVYALMDKDTTDALKTLNRAIEKYPEYEQYYMIRAEIKYAKKDYEPAMVDLNSYCSLHKTCGEAAFLKGMIKYREHDYHAAITMFSDYTSEMDEGKGWIYLGLCHMALEHYAPAAQSFERALKREPKNAAALYNAGLCFYRDGKYDQALPYFKRAVENTPGDRNLQMAYALNLTKMENYIESNKVLRFLLELNAQDAEAMYNIGVNYFHLHERDLSCDYFTRAKTAGNLSADVAIEQHCRKRPK